MYYTKDGYLDMHKLLNKEKATYIFIVGARAVGKTFGALKEAIDSNMKFIFMRRTQTQVDMIKSDELNPFNALTSVLGKNYKYMMKNINKNITGVYRAVFDYEKQLDVVADGNPLGYIMALSTVSNIRGFDASDVDLLIYDEFIGEKHEKPIASEGTAFLNAIETISRNRELSGSKPLKVICMANSSDLANPIFLELKLITICEKMLSKGKDYVYLKDRDVAIYMLHDSPISKKKQKTSLYKLAGNDSDFSKMSLYNEFNKEYFGQVKSMVLTEFRPVVKVGEIVIYKHKGKRLWYVTAHASGKTEVYDSSQIELKRFANDYYYLKLAYLNRHMFFESYVQQVLFEKYINI